MDRTQTFVERLLAAPLATTVTTVWSQRVGRDADPYLQRHVPNGQMELRWVGSALGLAQVLPALAGALLGIFPGSFALFAVINAANDNDAVLPPTWQVLAVVLGTVVAVTALTAVPARLGARRPAAATLQAEHP